MRKPSRFVWGPARVLSLALVFGTAARAAEYSVSYVVFPPAKATAGEVFSLPVGIQNTGTKTWARDDCAANTNFFVSYHWAIGGISVGENYEGQRTPVPQAMKPGDSKKLTMVVQAPKTPGNYTLELDMVEEGVNWFSTSADKAKTGGPFSVTVQPAPATGSLDGVSFWFPLATPTSPQKVFVLRRGNCAVELDFGDGTKASLAASDAGALHPFGKGKFTVKATGCGQTVTGALEVADTACPFILPAVKVCDQILECCDIFPDLCAALGNLFPGPPQIASVDYEGGLHPGDSFAIQGEGFTLAKVVAGKAELLLKDPKGQGVTVSLEIASSADWTKSFVLGRIPSATSGVGAQTGQLRITRSDGKTSNLYPVVFAPTLEVQTVPPEMVTVACDNDVSCNRCNDSEDGCEVSGPAMTSIQGWHQSLPLVNILGACAFGGGGGTDHYSVNLTNGWMLQASALHKLYGVGTASPSGFAIGSSAVSGSVSWHVDSCEVIDYSVDLIAIGPRGVPMQ
jgi:hypothetical protein